MSLFRPPRFHALKRGPVVRQFHYICECRSVRGTQTTCHETNSNMANHQAKALINHD